MTKKTQMPIIIKTPMIAPAISPILKAAESFISAVSDFWKTSDKLRNAGFFAGSLCLEQFGVERDFYDLAKRNLFTTAAFCPPTQ
jgi:hypothetical protein